MPLESCHFYAEVNSVTNEIAVRAIGSEEDLAAVMVCAICKSKKFRDVFKLTQRVLIAEGINLQVSRAKYPYYPIFLPIISVIFAK